MEGHAWRNCQVSTCYLPGHGLKTLKQPLMKNKGEAVYIRTLLKPADVHIYVLEYLSSLIPYQAIIFYFQFFER